MGNKSLWPSMNLYTGKLIPNVDFNYYTIFIFVAAIMLTYVQATKMRTTKDGRACGGGGKRWVEIVDDYQTHPLFRLLSKKN